MDKIECPLFHEFDNACCGDRECGFQKEMRVIPLEDKELTGQLAAQHSLLALMLLVVIFGFGGLFWLVQWEQQLRQHDTIHQEALLRPAR